MLSKFLIERTKLQKYLFMDSSFCCCAIFIITNNWFLCSFLKLAKIHVKLPTEASEKFALKKKIC